MNYIENKKYLKSNDLHFYIGWCLLGVGVFLFVVGELFWLYILPYQWIFSILAIIAGALTAFLPRMNRGTEESLDEAVKKTNDELCQIVLTTLEKKLKNKGEPPAVVGHYLLSGKDLIIRKGRKDEKVRSSRYTTALLSFTKDELHILQSTFSLISDESSQQVYEIPYQHAPHALIEEVHLTLPKGSYLQKELVILENEHEIVRIPVENSVFVDELCRRINTEKGKKV